METNKLLLIIAVFSFFILLGGFILFGKNADLSKFTLGPPPHNAKADFPGIIQNDSQVIDNANTVQKTSTLDSK